MQISGEVREFDENLFKLLEDMKKISEANNLKGLSAIQLGVPLKIVVFKKDNDFLELINPSIYFYKGFVTSKETDETIPAKEFEIKRYENIKVTYFDRNNNQKFLELKGDDAIWLQRKIDLTFGGLLINKLPKKEAKKFIKEYQNQSCPTTFIKDKILFGIKVSVILEIFAFILKFFIKYNPNIIPVWSVINILAILFYLFYSNYETKKYKNCTSCQGANAIGNSLIFGTISIIIFLLNLFL